MPTSGSKDAESLCCAARAREVQGSMAGEESYGAVDTTPVRTPGQPHIGGPPPHKRPSCAGGRSREDCSATLRPTAPLAARRSFTLTRRCQKVDSSAYSDMSSYAVSRLTAQRVGARHAPLAICAAAPSSPCRSSAL
eukprot:2394228-Prymnesium_polylepis.2